jgi:hypothetical protein
MFAFLYLLLKFISRLILLFRYACEDTTGTCEYLEGTDSGACWDGKEVDCPGCGMIRVVDKDLGNSNASGDYENR